jgi:hypothetical protein
LTGAFLDGFATGGQNGPIDLVFGPDRNLYVLNSPGTNLEVLRFNGSTGAFINVFVSSFSGGTDGSSLIFGPDGNLYVTTGFIGNSVRRFNGSTGQFIDEFVPSRRGGLTNATGLVFLVPSPRVITIDIKPGSFPNSVNPNNNGVITVAILTTSTFDATTVDPLIVKFGPNEATEAHQRGHNEDADGDGDIDLVLHFRTQETGIRCGDTSVSLTGPTFGGQRITGSESINTVGCK